MKAKQRLLQIALCILILFTFTQIVAAQYPHQTIMNNGDSRTRVDIVIVSEGYTAAQMNQFHTDAQNLVQYMFTQQPYAEYQRYFNVHRMDVASAQSGADHPAAHGDGSCGWNYTYYPPIPVPGTCVNTAFNATYGDIINTVQRLLTVNSAGVRNAVSTTFQPAQIDLIFVIVNDPEYGGSGGDIAVTSIATSTNLADDAREIVLHEIGHTFAHLDDEYTETGAHNGCNQFQAYAENIETQDDVTNRPRLLKWNAWINRNTPIPTPWAYGVGIPGAYGGAHRFCLDLYRPTDVSKMNALGYPYEQINTEQFVRYIYNYVSLPDASQPAASSVTVQQGQSQTFGVSIPLPITHSLNISWSIDGGAAAGTGTFFTLNTNNLSPGTHTVTVYVSDPTQLVIRYYLQQQRTWNVTITSPPQQPNPIDEAHFFVHQHYVDFLDREPDQGGWDYWAGQITQCGTNQQCIHDQRVGVSAAFFVEQEFQQTGYYVYRFYKAAYGRRPTFAEFMPDRTPLADTVDLEASKMAFANNWVARDVFKQVYPDYLSNDQFVNQLFDTAGLVPYTAERQQESQDMLNGKTRAQVLRDVIEITDFKNREYNPAFVLMQYFGYLRRDPDEGGYQFWLNNLNQYNNINGMVDAFVNSAEYRARFGQP